MHIRPHVYIYIYIYIYCRTRDYLVVQPLWTHGNKPLLDASAQGKPEIIDIWFPQDELDKANKKDKKHFPPGFKVIYSEGF